VPYRARQEIKPVPTVEEFTAMKMMMAEIAKTEFVPLALRGKPDAALAAILYGRELGFPPMTALKYVQVIQGQPTVAPRAMAALIRRAGHVLKLEKISPQKARITGARRDTGETQTVEWTIDQARRAGLVREGSGWQKYPEDMLFARAMGTLGRRLFEDVVLGSYSPEEMQDSEVIESRPVPPPTADQTSTAVLQPSTSAAGAGVDPTPVSAITTAPAPPVVTATPPETRLGPTGVPPGETAVATAEPEDVFEDTPKLEERSLGELRVRTRDTALRAVVAHNQRQNPGVAFTERQINSAADLTIHKWLMANHQVKFENASTEQLLDLIGALEGKIGGIA